MKVCTCFLLFAIFAYTNSTTRGKPTNSDIDVKPALANVSELSNIEYSGDTNDSNNVHKNIRRETTTIDKNNTTNPVSKEPRVETVTDFIQEAINIINTYNDTAFEDFFQILDKEIRRYHYKDCKFSEVMQNPDTRSWLAGTLKIIRGKSVSFIKAAINEKADIMRDKTYENNVKELLDYIDSLYRHTEHKLHKVLKELKDSMKTKSLRTHKNIIKRGVRQILFDHYTALDSNTRRGLNERIETFWNRFKHNPASDAKVSNNHEMNAVSRSVIDSFKVENIIQKAKELVTYSKNYLNKNLKNESERWGNIYDGDTKQNISDSESVLEVKSRSRNDGDKQQQHGKPEKSKSKSNHAKKRIFVEYNAEIDVQLANTELLRFLSIFKTVPDKRRANTSNESSLTPTKQDRMSLHTRPAKKRSGLRTGPEIKPKTPIALKKPRAKYSRTHDYINEYLTPLSKLRSDISNLFSKESNVVMQLLNDNNLDKGLQTTSHSTRERPRTRQRSRKRRHQKKPPKTD